MGVFIIGEAGVNHNGDINLAKKLIDIAIEAKVDAVKFQTFKTEKIIGKFAKKADYQNENTNTNESQYDMVKKLELSFNEFKELKKYCDERNIIFVSTPDDKDSVDLLSEMNVPYIKIGSTEVTNFEYLKYIAKKNIPIILSTGMSTLGEVEKALDAIYSTGNKNVKLLHATTDYPTKEEDVNLNAMLTMKEAFKVEVGYSDHTLGNEAAIAAVAMGAKVIEKHFTIDKNMEGPDHKASMEPEELKEFVKSIRKTEKLLGNGIKSPTEREKKIIKDVRRSIVASRNLKKGTILTRNMLEFKRPGTGLYPEFIDFVIGKQIKRDIQEDEVIRLEDL